MICIICGEDRNTCGPCRNLTAQEGADLLMLIIKTVSAKPIQIGKD